MRDKKWRHVPGGRRVDTCDHRLSRSSLRVKPPASNLNEECFSVFSVFSRNFGMFLYYRKKPRNTEIRENTEIPKFVKINTEIPKFVKILKYRNSWKYWNKPKKQSKLRSTLTSTCSIIGKPGEGYNVSQPDLVIHKYNNIKAKTKNVESANFIFTRGIVGTHETSGGLILLVLFLSSW